MFGKRHLQNVATLSHPMVCLSVCHHSALVSFAALSAAWTVSCLCAIMDFSLGNSSSRHRESLAKVKINFQSCKKITKKNTQLTHCVRTQFKLALSFDLQKCFFVNK